LAHVFFLLLTHHLFLLLLLLHERLVVERYFISSQIFLVEDQKGTHIETGILWLPVPKQPSNYISLLFPSAIGPRE
jgi:hypothetical protein